MKVADSSFGPLWLRLETMLLTSTDEIITKMCEQSTALQMPVVVNVNGEDLQALPGESAEQVKARINKLT